MNQARFAVTGPTANQPPLVRVAGDIDRPHHHLAGDLRP
jgi:hypothetical protein